MDNLKEDELSGSSLKVYKTFKKMGLKADLLKGIHSHGFEHPSLIQQRAIVPITKGRDLIAQSQSGKRETCKGKE